jgi:hypothetical protein
METNQITFMPIVDKDMYVVWWLTMHDLLRNWMK